MAFVRRRRINSSIGGGLFLLPVPARCVGRSCLVLSRASFGLLAVNEPISFAYWTMPSPCSRHFVRIWSRCRTCCTVVIRRKSAWAFCSARVSSFLAAIVCRAASIAVAFAVELAAVVMLLYFHVFVGKSRVYWWIIGFCRLHPFFMLMITGEGSAKRSITLLLLDD